MWESADCFRYIPINKAVKWGRWRGALIKTAMKLTFHTMMVSKREPHSGRWRSASCTREAPACQGPRGRTLRAAAPNGRWSRGRKRWANRTRQLRGGRFPREQVNRWARRLRVASPLWTFHAKQVHRQWGLPNAKINPNNSSCILILSYMLVPNIAYFMWNPNKPASQESPCRVKYIYQ